MRNLIVVAVAAACSSASPALAQVASATATNSYVLGGFTLASGGGNLESDTVVTAATTDGILTNQLGIRFRDGGLHQAQLSDAAGVYAFALSTSPIMFDFSLFGGTADANIMLTNLGTGQTASFNPLSIAGNVTTPFGSIQNSGQLVADFLNDDSLLASCCGNIGFNAGANNTYRLVLSAGGYTATAFAQIGTGATSAVPEPATWACMLVGFGAIGGALRRRQVVSARMRFA